MATHTRVIALDDESQLEEITRRINEGEDPDAVFEAMGVEVISTDPAAAEAIFDGSPETRASIDRAKVARDKLNTASAMFGDYISPDMVEPEDVAEARQFLQAGPNAAVITMGLLGAAEAFTKAANTVSEWVIETGKAAMYEKAADPFTDSIPTWLRDQ